MAEKKGGKAQTTREVKLGEITMLNVPEFYASQIQAYVSSSDFTMVFGRQVPVVVNQKEHGTTLHPAVALHLSPQTAKDVNVLLSGLIERYEDEWGEIETDFTQRRKSEAKAESRKK